MDLEDRCLRTLDAKYRTLQASSSGLPVANPWYAVSNHGKRLRSTITACIAAHCSCVGSTPVGLCAQACSSTMDPSGMALRSAIMPSKSRPRVVASQYRYDSSVPSCRQTREEAAACREERGRGAAKAHGALTPTSATTLLWFSQVGSLQKMRRPGSVRLCMGRWEGVVPPADAKALRRGIAHT